MNPATPTHSPDGLRVTATSPITPIQGFEKLGFHQLIESNQQKAMGKHTKHLSIPVNDVPWPVYQQIPTIMSEVLQC